MKVLVSIKTGGHSKTICPLTFLGLGEEERDEGVLGLAQHAHHGLVNGILVLVQPARDVVANSAGVVMQLEVHLVLGVLAWLGLAEVLGLTQMVLVQLGLE